MAVTDYKFPGTCATVDQGGADWSNFNNAKASDNADASATVDKLSLSDWLRATNFDFSEIPSGATIDGIEVKIEHQGDGTYIKDYGLYLRKTSGQVGSNYASGTAWAASDAEVTYGGATDKWGTTWADTDINNSNFGIDLAAVSTDQVNAQAAFVDCISIRVYYTAAVTFIPFRNYYPHILPH